MTVAVWRTAVRRLGHYHRLGLDINCRRHYSACAISVAVGRHDDTPIDTTRFARHVHELLSGYEIGRDHDAVVLLVTPDVHGVVEDEGFVSGVLSALAPRHRKGRVPETSVLSAVVDGLPLESRRDSWSSGISLLTGRLDDMMPDLWKDQQQPSDDGGGGGGNLTFQISGPTESCWTTVTMPLAPSLFLSSRRTTLLASRWQDLKSGFKTDGFSSRISQRVNVGLRADSPLPDCSVPLLPVTPARRVVDSCGNILSRLEVDSNSVPASTELEVALKQVYDFRSSGVVNDTTPPPPPLLVWALTIPSEIMHHHNADPSSPEAPPPPPPPPQSRELGELFRSKGIDFKKEQERRNTLSDPSDPSDPSNLDGIKSWNPSPRGDPEEKLGASTAALLSGLLRLGCRLHRIQSGGGGWGLKEGLLSLDSAVMSDDSPNESDSATNDGPFLGHDLAAIGSYVQFFIMPGRYRHTHHHARLSRDRRNRSWQSVVLGTGPELDDEVTGVQRDLIAPRVVLGKFGAISKELHVKFGVDEEQNTSGSSLKISVPWANVDCLL